MGGDVALEGDEVLGALVIAVLREDVCPGGEAGVGAVHVVGRAAEHAHAVAGVAIEGAVAKGEVVGGEGDDVAGGHGGAGPGIGDEAVGGMGVLVVKVAGHAAGGGAEGGVGGDVGDALAVEEDVAVVAEAVEVLVAGASAAHRLGSAANPDRSLSINRRARSCNSSM